MRADSTLYCPKLIWLEGHRGLVPAYHGLALHLVAARLPYHRARYLGRRGSNAVGLHGRQGDMELWAPTRPTVQLPKRPARRLNVKERAERDQNRMVLLMAGISPLIPFTLSAAISNGSW